jgi:hypothetical protein
VILLPWDANQTFNNSSGKQGEKKSVFFDPDGVVFFSRTHLGLGVYFIKRESGRYRNVQHA